MKSYSPETKDMKGSSALVSNYFPIPDPTKILYFHAVTFIWAPEETQQGLFYSNPNGNLRHYTIRQPIFEL